MAGPSGSSGGFSARTPLRRPPDAPAGASGGLRADEWAPHTHSPARPSSGGPTQLLISPALESRLPTGDVVMCRDAPHGRAVESGYRGSVPDAYERVDPEGWRVVALRVVESEGSIVDLELLRPVSWLEERGVTLDASFWLDIESVRVYGQAEVLSILDCPLIHAEQNSNQRVVTCTMRRRATDLCDLKMVGEASTQRGTSEHPFMSLDRGSWIPLSQLAPGERVSTYDGIASIVECVEQVCGEADVFNIEVHRSHTYFVGSADLLVHNVCPGRGGRQGRLRELADDPKLGSADRGWLKQEINQIKRGKRKNIRLPGSSRGKPGGKVLAHRRGMRAKDGHSYKHSDLQDVDLHKLEHRFGGY